MTKYKCGHKTNGVILLDDNVLSFTAYFDWYKSVGVFGTKELCFECYLNKLKENSKQ